MSENFWTDELVKEFAQKWHGDKSFDEVVNDLMPKMLANFKASKTKAKDYEILSFIFKGLTYLLTLGKYYNELGGYFEIAPNECEIKIVKRLSDGEIFELHKTKVIEQNTKHEWVISDMYIGRDNKIFLNGVWLNHVQKVKQPIPLFTTEDGKEIFESDTFYSVDTEKWNWLGWMATIKDVPCKKSSHKYFSTEAAAKEYILLNKPCLSVNDIITYKDFIVCERSISQLKEFVKSKL